MENISSVSSLPQATPRGSGEPWLIVIAASAGGIQALTTVLGALPADLPASVVVVQHRFPARRSRLEQILARSALMPVLTATDDRLVEPGAVYIARPDLHLTIRPNRRFSYVDGTRIRHVLSSANPLFESAASAFEQRTIAVVLSGSGMDATDGVQTVKKHGGTIIAQDEATAQYFGMPSAAIKTGAVDHVLPLDAIAPALVAIVNGQPVQEAI